MDLKYDGIYCLSVLSSFELCTSMQRLPLFPMTFRNLKQVKALALETALAVDHCNLKKKLGNEIEDTVPLDWLRPLAGCLRRI
ncbi:uncharacterized protein BYT42DRAFT_563646 [Radiomyces spectabilis]|uniref:uncharacterized protein n=1 Tax=Radiomyces spectabilis TaxID=64574 RepID=UPI00221E5D20|nr:uncharacterized protein BYT42DRAFT_563646 [Radiomyces spectabilis]KAI8384783.1 hypothetical protein BYT42DRAFT_563646 [Radiomyces spectabilis]